MIEPDVTAVLGRRYLAFLIDSSLVVATGLGVAYQQSTAFEVVGRDTQGQPLVDPAEFSQIEELLDFELFGRAGVFGRPFVRFQEIGDTVRVFGADSYVFGLLAAMVMTLVVFAAVPMVLKRTVGMLPFGLGIRTTDGQVAGPYGHLLRTFGLAIDLVPFVLPGALGFVAAKGSQLNQRVGDRIAGTTVVDLHALELADIPTEKLDLRLSERPQDADDSIDMAPPAPAPPAPVGAPAAAAPAATYDEVTSASSSPEVAPPPAPSPIQAFEAAEASAKAAAEAAAAARIDAEPHRHSAPTDHPIPAGAGTVRNDLPSPHEPPPAKRSSDTGFGDLLPPPPVHRSSSGDAALGKPTPAAASASSAPPPPTNTAASPAAGVERSLAERIDAPTADQRDLPNQAPLPLDLSGTDQSAQHLERPDATWQPPEAQPAPVWQPAPLETAPIEAPDPTDGRTLDDVVLPQPSTGSLVSESPLPEDSPLREAPQSTAGAGATPTAKAPVWSDKWRAWMYWDPKRKCWLRHDTSTNTWEPVA